MNISDTSNILTVGLGGVTVCSWLIAFFKFLVKQHGEAKILSEDGKRIAEQLLTHATNPTRRADIYFYMSIKSQEFNSRRLKTAIQITGACLFWIVELFFGLLFSRLGNITISEPLMIAFTLTNMTFIISFIMFTWFSNKINKFESGWENGIMASLRNKLDKHLD